MVRSLTEEKEDDTIYHKEEDEFWRHAPGEKGRFNLFVDDDSFFSSCVFVSSSPFLSFFDGRDPMMMMMMMMMMMIRCD